MPDEYISREAAIEEIDKWLDTVGTALVGKGLSYYGELIGCIEDARAADVAPVVHGEWLRYDDDWDSLTTIRCSLCSEEWCFETDDDVSLLNYKYCPNCGARMDGGKDDEAD